MKADDPDRNGDGAARLEFRLQPGRVNAELPTQLRQSPNAALNVQQQPGVAENLELLANFGPDIPIIRMQLLQFAGEGVGVGGGEFRLGADFSPLQRGRQLGC